MVFLSMHLLIIDKIASQVCYDKCIFHIGIGNTRNYYYTDTTKCDNNLPVFWSSSVQSWLNAAIWKKIKYTNLVNNVYLAQIRKVHYWV